MQKVGTLSIRKSQLGITGVLFSVKLANDKIINMNWPKPNRDDLSTNWAASSEFGTYCLCEQRRFRRACAFSPEPPLLAHTSSESRGTFRQKARSLAPLNGWACAVKICHDGMLEDTNSLDAVQLRMGWLGAVLVACIWSLLVCPEFVFTGLFSGGFSSLKDN